MPIVPALVLALAGWTPPPQEGPPEGGAAEPAGPTRVELSYRAFRTFEFELPDEVFAPVGDGFPIAHAGGERFAARVEGGALRVDVDGDGRFEALVEAPAPGTTAVVTLRGTGSDGEPVVYAARVRVGRSGWEYSCSGGLVGNLGGTKVVVLDQDLDGVYGEPGEDAVVVGRGRVAAPMSAVLLVDDGLFRARLEPGALVLEPYDGPTGVLDLLSGYETRAKVLSMQVEDAARDLYFDLARAEGGARLPVGEYRLRSGLLASGDNRVRLARGRSKPFPVEADGRTAPEWGGPLRAEFEYAQVGSTYQFSPDAVWYHGRGGEQYVGWTPLGPSPRFVLLDQATRAELVSGVFPGS